MFYKSSKRYWLAVLNGAFGLGLLIPIISEMYRNGGNIVLEARPVAENYSAADTIFVLLFIGMFIVNSIAWALED